MKLSKWVKDKGISYRTGWQMFKDGKITGAYKLETGTIIVPDEETGKEEKIVIYSRVSSSQNKDNLETQADRLTQYCMAKGYKIDKVVKEIGSGLNDNRPKLIDILGDKNITKIVIENKDRLTRFGFNYIEILCKLNGCEIEIVNPSVNDKEDLIQDFISVITSFYARIYGQRRSKRNTEKLIKDLEIKE